MIEIEVGPRKKRSGRGKERGPRAAIKELRRGLLVWRKEGFEREDKARDKFSRRMWSRNQSVVRMQKGH